MQEQSVSKKRKKEKSSQIADYVFNFKPSNSFFNNLNPVSKLLWFVFMTYIVLIQNSLLILSGMMICIFFLGKLNGIGFRELIRKLRWIIIIVIILIILNIFFNAIPSGKDEILFYIWYPYIPIRRLAVYFGVKVGIWVLSLSTCGLIFLITTPPKDLVYGLRKLKLPYKLAFSMMVGLRYIPIIQDNTNAVIIAQKARGLERANAKSFRRVLEMIKDRLSTSLILVMRNATYTAISMELRAFGRFKDRTDLYKVKFEGRDIFFLSILIFFIVFLTLYRFNLLPFIPPVPSIYSLIWGS